MNGSESATPNAAKGGLFEDIIEVLYAPSKVFDRAKDKNAFTYMLVTAIVAAVIMVGTKGLMQPWLDAMGDLVIKQAAARGKPIPDAALESTRTFTGYSMLVGVPLVMLIGPYFNAFFLKIAGMISKVDIPFGRLAVIATLAGIPRLIGTLLMPVQALMLNGESARSIADLGFSPARFIDPTSQSQIVLTLLQNFDLFRIWQLALIAVGVMVVGRASKGAAIVSMLGMFFFTLLCQLVPAALGGG